MIKFLCPTVELSGKKNALYNEQNKKNTRNGRKTTHSPELFFSTGVTCCVPVTAHVLKGESNIPIRVMLGKSQAQPGGGEGRSAIATGIR